MFTETYCFIFRVAELAEICVSGTLLFVQQTTRLRLSNIVMSEEFEVITAVTDCSEGRKPMTPHTDMTQLRSCTSLMGQNFAHFQLFMK